MIFILTEQIMNGTVTMDILTTGIEAESFEKAVEKIKKLSNFKNVTIHVDTDTMFDYTFPKNGNNDFPIFGNLQYKPLNII
jgi:hypothetical protein